MEQPPPTPYPLPPTPSFIRRGVGGVVVNKLSKLFRTHSLKYFALKYLTALITLIFMKSYISLALCQLCFDGYDFEVPYPKNGHLERSRLALVWAVPR